ERVGGVPVDGRVEAAGGIELAVHDRDAEMVERLRQRGARTPAVARRIVLVEPRHRPALLATAGRQKPAADRTAAASLVRSGRGALSVQVPGGAPCDCAGAACIRTASRPTALSGM